MTAPDTGDAATPEPAEPPEPSEPPGPAEPRYGRLRRAPRYGSFVVTGVVIGVVVALIVSLGRPATGQFSENSVIGYVAAIFGLVGALIGAACAIFFDRRKTKPPTP